MEENLQKENSEEVVTAINPEDNVYIKQTKKELFWEIFRFLLVGGTATVFDYLVHALVENVLHSLTGWTTAALWIATASGFLVGMLFNWMLSVIFVFRAVRNKKEATSKKSFLLFVIISVIGLVMTLVGVWLLKTYAIPEFDLFKTAKFLGVTWNEWLAKAIMTGIVLVWNYIGRKIFVFKS